MELKLSINPPFLNDGVRGQHTDKWIQLFLENIFWDCYEDVDKLPEGLNNMYLIEMICTEYINEIQHGKIIPPCMRFLKCPIAKMLKNSGFRCDMRYPDGKLFEI